MYQDFCATFVIDPVDAGETQTIESLDMKVVIRNTVMSTMEDKQQLARDVLELFESKATGAA
ncbi:MAG: hypothetical protein WBD73_07210, partial [Candidatus Acidiferrales bacterium]